MELDPILTPIYSPEAQLILGLHSKDYLVACQLELLPASWVERYRQTNVIRRHTLFDLSQYWRFANELFCPVAISSVDFAALWSSVEFEVFEEEISVPAFERVRELAGRNAVRGSFDWVGSANGERLIEYVLDAFDLLVHRTQVTLEYAPTEQFELITRAYPPSDPFGLAPLTISQRN